MAHKEKILRIEPLSKQMWAVVMRETTNTGLAKGKTEVLATAHNKSGARRHKNRMLAYGLGSY